MSRRRDRLLLLFTLALLQCLAPLLHGHVGASHVHGVHLHLSMGPQVDPGHGSGTALEAQDEEGGAAIGVATSYKRDAAWLPMPAALPLVFMVLIVASIAWRPPRTIRSPAGLAPHLRPFATAPPAPLA